MFSRRKFLKSSITVAGIGAIGINPVSATDCPAESLTAPGPIPLNNILIDYRQLIEKYGQGLKKVSICDKENWEIKRLSILRRSGTILGEAPPMADNGINPVILEETPRDGYKELRLQFPSGNGDMITGYLLIPDGSTSSFPRPAIIALHSTGPGARQTVGLDPKENRSYGMELAQRGYVVLATDVISAGARIYKGYEPYYTNEFYNEYPRWSAMDKMIHDHKKGLDYLCSLAIVDSDRLGCIGHSLGGYNSFFLQAFEPRIKAAVSSCGFSTMGGSSSPYQFARDDWFAHFNPACRDFISSGIIPCDIHEIMALCAPRPLFNYSAKQDAVYYPPAARKDNSFDEWWQSVDMALSQVKKVYELHGAADNFVHVESDGGHDFPADVKDKAYPWLDKYLLT